MLEPVLLWFQTLQRLQTELLCSQTKLTYLGTGLATTQALRLELLEEELRIFSIYHYHLLCKSHPQLTEMAGNHIAERPALPAFRCRRYQHSTVTDRFRSP